MDYMTYIERIYIFASIIAVLSLIIVVAKFVTKRFQKKSSVLFNRVDTKLMKIHKSSAKILIVSGTLHGMLTLTNFTQYGIKPYIMGTICLLCCIASAACFYLKKRLKSTKSWVLYHRFFAVISLAAFIGHIALSR